MLTLLQLERKRRQAPPARRDNAGRSIPWWCTTTSGEGMGTSLVSKIVQNCSAPEIHVKKKQQEIFATMSFLLRRRRDKARSVSSGALETSTSDARVSEIQQVETRREDGTELEDNKDDIWALSADVTFRHHETAQNTMLRTKRPSRCHGSTVT